MVAMGQESLVVKRILELNGESPLIGALKSLYEKDPSAASLPEYAELLYDQALISEGATLPDPAQRFLPHWTAWMLLRLPQNRK